jgi:hypothetical protein
MQALASDQRLHTCGTGAPDLMDASCCSHAFATIHMTTYLKLVYKNECQPQASNQRVHTCSTGTTDLMDASCHLNVFATTYMDTFVFWFKISVPKHTQAMRIEPAHWSVDASHHISRICEYMKTTLRRLQFVFKLIWPEKTGKKWRGLRAFT